jgi:hypothetical protein
MRTIAAAAYQHYVSRIGQAPAPMTAETHRAEQDGFRRVYFRKPLD